MNNHTSKTQQPVFFVSILLGMLCAIFADGRQASAAGLDLYIPSITGENSTPGYPGAMAIQSVTISPDSFSIEKNVDKASPTIFADATSAKLLHTADLLLYNTAPSGPPDAMLSFENVVASSYLVSGGGTTEQDTFAATTPDSMYLLLPGITGQSSTPGYTGLMQIDSLTITGNDFTITKTVDKASTALEALVVTGTPISQASVLFYNSAPSGAPDAILSFQELLASSYHNFTSGELPKESVSFAYATAAPEPSALALAGMAALGLFVAASRGGRE